VIQSSFPAADRPTVVAAVAIENVILINYIIVVLESLDDTHIKYMHSANNGDGTLIYYVIVVTLATIPAECRQRDINLYFLIFSFNENVTHYNMCDCIMQQIIIILLSYT
jgi:hypothetical protein